MRKLKKKKLKQRAGLMYRNGEYQFKKLLQKEIDNEVLQAVKEIFDRSKIYDTLGLQSNLF